MMSSRTAAATARKSKAAKLMAVMTVLGASLGMSRADASDATGLAPSKAGGPGQERTAQSDQLKLDSNQMKYKSLQYKENVDQASPKLYNRDNTQTNTPDATHALNPQPLPPGQK